jgi:hypothetical protein
MADNILYPHSASEIPPIAEDKLSRQFETSDTFFAEVIDPDQDEYPLMMLVYYSHREKSWIDSNEGEEVEVIIWWSRKEVPNG